MAYITITDRWTDATFSSERLIGDAGSVALTCCADAKRTATSQGEGEPQSLAVAPGEAEAAILAAMEALSDEASELRQLSKMLRDNYASIEDIRSVMRKAGRFDDIVTDLSALLPEPDSDAPLGASGRRNEKSPSTGATEKAKL